MAEQEPTITLYPFGVPDGKGIFFNWIDRDTLAIYTLKDGVLTFIGKVE